MRIEYKSCQEKRLEENRREEKRNFFNQYQRDFQHKPKFINLFIILGLKQGHLEEKREENKLKH